MTRIAIIEDDADIGWTIQLNLEKNGHEVQRFFRGSEGLSGVQEDSFDLVILDLNLPDLDGFTICRELRRTPSTRALPILMLTARASERDRVTGLELGADDYLSKPFGMPELLARVSALLRRARGFEAQQVVYDDGRLRVDPSSHRVFVSGEEVRLARKEFELLWLLIRSRPAVVPRDRMLSEVWQMADNVETRTVDAHIRNLRKKIGRDRISTIIGLGYRFEG